MIEEEVVYVRTDEGEIKAKQPRSISSHELRAMLLLIDGRLSTRELRRRFGKSLAIDKSIAELIKLGWIREDAPEPANEPDFVTRKAMPEDDSDAVEESPDTALEAVSREAEALGVSRQYVEEGQAPAVSSDAQTLEPSTPMQTEAPAMTDTPNNVSPAPDNDGTSTAPADTVEPSEDAEPHDHDAPVQAREPQGSLDTATARSEDDILFPEDEPLAASAEAPDDVQPVREEPTMAKTTPVDVEADAREPSASDEPSLSTLASDSEERGSARLDDARPNLADRSRGGIIAARFFLARLWRLLLPVAAVVAVAVLIAAAFVLPERHRPEIAAALRAHVGRDVTFSDLKLSEVAGGSIALEQVRFSGLPSVTAAAIYLTPDWGSVLKTMSWRFDAHVHGLVGNAPELATLAMAPLDAGKIDEFVFDDLSVTFGSDRLGKFSGQMTSEALVGSREVTLTDASGSLTLKAQPGQDGFLINAVGVKRALAILPKVSFDSYEMDAQVTADGLEITQFGGAAYAGKVTARGKLVLDPQASAELDIELGKVDGARLMELAGMNLDLEGPVDARLSLRASAPSAVQMISISSLGGDFGIDSGRLGRFDFGAALRERGTGKVLGGETRFESMRGDLSYEDGGARLVISRLDAGALDASGTLRASADGAVSGRVSASVETGGRRVRVPVTVMGTLVEPVLETPKPLPPVKSPVPVETLTPPVQPNGLPEDEIPVVPGGLRQ